MPVPTKRQLSASPAAGPSSRRQRTCAGSHTSLPRSHGPPDILTGTLPLPLALGFYDEYERLPGPAFARAILEARPPLDDGAILRSWLVRQAREISDLNLQDSTDAAVIRTLREIHDQLPDHEGVTELDDLRAVAGEDVDYDRGSLFSFPDDPEESSPGDVDLRAILRDRQIEGALEANLAPPRATRSRLPRSQAPRPESPLLRSR
ncbi:hypothetical protein FQN51_004998, partial [Onygenales sp. PD_10]